MSRAVDRAKSLFSQGFSCSQSVLAPLAESRGVDTELALRISAAFGGGMARSGGTCGAVSGAVMAIGLEHGRISADDLEAKSRCYDVGEEYLKRFRAREGATACRDLLGYDLSKPEDARQAREEGLFSSLCPRLVATAVELAEQLLGERPGPFAPAGEGGDE